jgi:hypothetical protein
VSEEEGPKQKKKITKKKNVWNREKDELLMEETGQ